MIAALIALVAAVEGWGRLQDPAGASFIELTLSFASGLALPVLLILLGIGVCWIVRWFTSSSSACSKNATGKRTD